MALIDQYSIEELTNIINHSFTYAEVVLKLGYATSHVQNIKILKDRIKKYNIDVSHFKISPSKIIRNEDNIFIENSTASQQTLRRWYLKGEYSEYKCSICNLEPFWNGKELTLILDHINGKNNDDRLNNLRWVCPNCNQQLETTGYKKMRVENKPEKKYYCISCGKEISRNTKNNLCLECFYKSTRLCERPTREELKNLIRTAPFTKIGQKYGVSDNAIRKWCDSYNLPRKSNDIKKYNDKEWELL